MEIVEDLAAVWVNSDYKIVREEINGCDAIIEIAGDANYYGCKRQR